MSSRKSAETEGSCCDKGSRYRPSILRMRALQSMLDVASEVVPYRSALGLLVRLAL